jgi:CBS-domain-containing membrane protein
MTQNKTSLDSIFTFLGIRKNTTSHTEKWLAIVGGTTGMLLVYFLYEHMLPHSSHLLIAASIGSTAVLLFGIPHGPLSKPWPVIGGHLVSATIGVTCYKVFHQPMVASACAVGFSLAGMLYLRCMHPPGGATALFAVIGGAPVHQLGYDFVFFPIVITTVLLLLFVSLYNKVFHRLARPKKIINEGAEHNLAKSGGLTHEDFMSALREMDTFIDVTPEDLRDIFTLAMAHASTGRKLSEKPLADHFYSNGELGDAWSVRKVIDIQGRKIKYQTVIGKDKDTIDHTSKYDFKRWAHYRVELVEGQWRRACC